jgi:hypothetical protein
MHVLPLFPLLLFRHGRQVVVPVGTFRESVNEWVQQLRGCIIPVVSDVLERHVVQLTGGDAKVRERLRGGINLLVNELALDIIGAVRRPPELVQGSSQRLRDSLGKVDARLLLQDHTVDQVRNLLLGVLSRTVKLKGCAGGVVVVGNGLEGAANVDNVHGEELLLPVVGAQHVAAAGERVQKPVLESVHGSRTNDGCLGEDGTRLNLTLALIIVSTSASCTDLAALTLVAKNSEGELGLALYDETWMYLSTSYLATDSAILWVPSTWTSSKEKFLAKDVSRMRAVPTTGQYALGGVITSDEVDDDVRMPHALLDGLCVSQVELLQICYQSVPPTLQHTVVLTMKLTLPRSPVTLRWRLAISSRKGMMTWHPTRAESRTMLLTTGTLPRPWGAYRVC